MFLASRNYGLLLFIGSISMPAAAQQGGSVSLDVVDGRGKIPGATVELLSPDSVLIKMAATDDAGHLLLKGLKAGTYFFRASHAGYGPGRSPLFTLADTATLRLAPISLETGGMLANVTVAVRKPFLEQKPGKTIVNLESSITAVGSTVAEALERLPNVSLDRNGNIALKGRPGVNVYIDGKPSNLSGTELATLLQGMSAANIAQIELLDQPPARYEASGGAGVINLITKKTRQKGLNGSVSAAISMGVHPKTNNAFQLALRSGRWTINSSYSLNAGRGYTRIEALRRYYDASGNLRALLDQPSEFGGRNSTHNLRNSIDYSVSDRTTLGLTLNGLLLMRQGSTHNEAIWQSPQGVTDSSLYTDSRSSNDWRNGGAGLSLRHSISKDRQVSVDLDGQWYRFFALQDFSNNARQAGAIEQAYRSDAPGRLRILSARSDYSVRTGRWLWETGGRIADINTDNEVVYEANEGSGWHPDLGRSNHFRYHEQIAAAYGSSEWKSGRWSLQGGLRFEATAYDARQLGNALVKDSSFSRSYSSLFPTLLVSFAADSNHTWTISAGRRIDRPQFQKLNPFSFFINKYTVQRGNPYFRPQYNWSADLTHTWKGWLSTGAGYSITTDYFAQFFPVDPNGLVVYTEGNLGKLQVLSFTASAQRAPAKWWNFSANVLLQHKIQEGFVEREYTARITQATFNLTNNFRFGKGWGAELSGQYLTRSQLDIQEVLDPSGNLSVGISKTILKGAGTLKLAGRDLTHTQWIKGNTVFRGVTEWFKVTRDSRVATLNFSWRFGKATRQTRRSGSANEEVQRVGNG
jgi:iron complex outermembrane receptor protein